jgi:hypothetical protein
VIDAWSIWREHLSVIGLDPTSYVNDKFTSEDTANHGGLDSQLGFSERFRNVDRLAIECPYCRQKPTGPLERAVSIFMFY